MLLRANLSDAYIHEGRPADALAAINLALPVARQHRDFRTERLLLHNATLAKLALGRVAEAKAEMVHVLELWQKDTGPGQRQEALREFGDALAKAGDTAGAIDLFHREEALSREIRAANKAAAEAELRARYDQESQKRRIELLGRDNQLKSAELDNQSHHAPPVDVRRRRAGAAGRARADDVPAHARAQSHAGQARGAAARAQRARRAHRPGQPAPVPRGDARARRRAGLQGRAADGGRRPLQARQRPLRPRRGRPRAGGGRAPAQRRDARRRPGRALGRRGVPRVRAQRRRRRARPAGRARAPGDEPGAGGAGERHRHRDDGVDRLRRVPAAGQPRARSRGSRRSTWPTCRSTPPRTRAATARWASCARPPAPARRCARSRPTSRRRATTAASRCTSAPSRAPTAWPCRGSPAAARPPEAALAARRASGRRGRDNRPLMPNAELPSHCDVLVVGAGPPGPPAPCGSRAPASTSCSSTSTTSRATRSAATA